MTRFAKAHAYGNDFVYVRGDELAGAMLDALAREMCDRHSGIGADGLIVYEEGGGLVSTRLFNADGTRAEVSGNGVRALAALLLENDSRLAAEVTIRTDAGTRRLARIAREGTRQTFRASMGAPVDVRKILPMEVAGESVQPAILNMGNPQCVVLGPLPDESRFWRLGRPWNDTACFRRAQTLSSLKWRRPTGCAFLFGNVASARPYRRARVRAQQWLRPRRLGARHATPRSSRRVELSASSGRLTMSI